MQDAVLRNLQVLAESSRKIPETLKAQYPEVDWRGIAGFRNILVHDYLGIDLERVWGVIANRLPGLKEVITAMKESLD